MKGKQKRILCCLLLTAGCGPNVQNFKNVNKGNDVVVRYTAALAITVVKP